MEAKALMELMWQRTDENLVEPALKDSISKLIAFFEQCNVCVTEYWIEYKLSPKTDFITEIPDFDKLAVLCEFMMKKTEKRACESWEKLLEAVNLIRHNEKGLYEYVHVASLEFDYEELVSESFCPSAFIEFDVEKIRKEQADIKWLLKMYSEDVLSPLLKADYDLLKDEKVVAMINKNIYPWNFGLMFSRESLCRIFYEPVPSENAQFLKNVFNLDDKFAKQLDLNSRLEFLMDYDYADGEIANVGVSAYYVDPAERKDRIRKYVEAGYITQEECNSIINWEHRTIVTKETGRRLVFWQIAHFKYKDDKPDAPMKLYLRIIDPKNQ